MLISLVCLASCAHLVVAQITPQNFQKALDLLPQLAQRAVDTNIIPGIAIAVVYNGSVQYAGGFGVKKVGEADKIDAETIFQLASLSKPISSTIVAGIVSKGNLTWESPINARNVLAQYPDPWVTNNLVIADGFTHRSGLFPLAGDDLELFNYNRTTIFQNLKASGPGGLFRIDYAYSNYGLTLAAESAAASAGLSWEDAADEYLYKPLGMNSTSSRYSDFLTRTDRAALHVPVTLANGSSGWSPTNPRNPDPQAPAGGATSNVADLAKWVQLQLDLGKLPNSDTQLVSQAALNATHAPVIIRGPNPITGAPAFYGYGWNVDYQDNRIWLDHAGAFSQGARTFVQLNVELGIGIVVLANAFPTGVPEGISYDFFDTALYGAARQDWISIWNGLYAGLAANFGTSQYNGTRPSDATPMLAAGVYEGEYKSDYVGVAKISAGQGGNGQDLTLTFPGYSNASVALTHWSRDTFFIQSRKNESGIGVIFSIGGDGNASSVLIEALNSNGGGFLEKFDPDPVRPEY